jgi:hypothetical protein
MRDLGNNYLFVVAIESYADPAVPDLPGTVSQIRELVQQLVTDFSFTNHHTIELYNEQATEENIDASFLNLKENLRDIDNLLILYSGHNFVREVTGEVYWVTYYGKPQSVTCNISSTHLASVYLAPIKAGQVGLLMNSAVSASALDTLAHLEASDFHNLLLLATGYQYEAITDQPVAPDAWIRAFRDYLNEACPESLSMLQLIQASMDYLESDYPNLAPTAFTLTEQDWKIARNTEEDRFWKQLLANPSLQMLNEYFTRFGEGKYCSEALRMKADVLALRAWEKAQRENTLDAYRRFILLHPNNRYVAEAEAARERILAESRQYKKGGHPAPPPKEEFLARKRESDPPARSEIIVGKKAPAADPASIRQRIKVTVRPKHPKGAPAAESTPPQTLEDQLQLGKLICQIPDQMRIGRDYSCEIRIAPAELAEEAFRRGLSPDAPAKDTLTISKVMMVELEESGNQASFRIKPESPVEQIVIAGDYTFWRYNILPLRAGEHRLLVKVTAKLNSPTYGERSRGLLVWKKLVEVATDFQTTQPGFTIVQDNRNGIYLDAEHLKDLLGKARIETVIQQLKDFLRAFDRVLYNQLVLIEQRFRQARSHAISQSLTQEENSVWQARISRALLAVIDGINIQEEHILCKGVDTDGQHLALAQLDQDMQEEGFFSH